MGTIGQIGPYTQNMDLSSYLERFEYFIDANGIDATKTKSTFLSVVGEHTYLLIKDLAQPAEVSTKSYTEIVDLLKKHLEPKGSIIVYRYKFDKLVRGIQEPISIYINKLRNMSEKCKFGSNLDERLRDKLVSSLNDERIISKLLSEGDSLTFDKACEISLQCEQNKKDAERLLSGETVHKMTFKGNSHTKRANNNYTSGYRQRSNAGNENGQKAMQFRCYRCGRANHRPENCFFKDKVCDLCHKKGHVKAACGMKFKSNHTNFAEKKSRNPTVKHIFTNSEEEYQIMTLRNDVSGSNPIVVKVKLNDVLTGMEVDTGASVSLITKDTWNKIKSDNLRIDKYHSKLKDYNGNPIKTWGKVAIPVEYENQHVTLSAFIVDEGKFNLLGRDWIQHLRLAWNDIMNVQVSHTLSDEAQSWMEQFPQVFDGKLGKYTGPKVHINVLPNTNPVFMRERVLPLSLRQKVQQTLDKMVEDGILTPVMNSEWATPIVPIIKKDQSVRICGDFRNTVNKCTSCDSYPLPTFEAMVHELMPGKIFSKLDLSQAYLQLVLDEESSKLCTLNTTFGLYKMNRLAYGVSSSPAIFQKTLGTLLKGIPRVVVYIDDILISGKTQAEHDQSVRMVLQRLDEVGLKVRKDKCEWNKRSVTFLGHIISENGVSPVPEKIEAIKQMKAPTNTSELKSFLGILNYYRKFMRDPATKLEPLHRLLRKSEKWRWGKEQQEAFQQVISLLTSWSVLTPFDPKKPLVLTTDASPVGIGAVLSHRTPDGQEQPIGFMSRSLNSAERNYSQTEKEALAMIYGVFKFQHYLIGHPFIIETDHRPLLGLFEKGYATSKIAAGRITRWCVYLNQFEYLMVYK